MRFKKGLIAMSVNQGRVKRNRPSIQEQSRKNAQPRSPLRGLAMLALSLVLAANCALATSIVGGNNLLTLSDADQLESWLGEGELVFTNIFIKDPLNPSANDSLDFHAAVDGMGRTFSLIEVIDGSGNRQQLIGGYNPQSWSSGGGYNITPNDSERTAFIFDLTTPQIYYQRPESWASAPGSFQTYNWNGYGPAFGGGHDLVVDSSLTIGATYAYSYGPPAAGSLTGIQGWSISVGQIEVFTIAAESTPLNPVPEPATVTLLGLGLGGMALYRKLRRRPRNSAM